MSEPKPCPFCGAAPEVDDDPDYPCVIQCVNPECGVLCAMDGADTKKQAVAIWNRRAALADAAAEAEPVAWMRKDGALTRAPRLAFGVCQRLNGEEIWLWEGQSFMEAVEAWKSAGVKDAAIVGWNHGAIATGDILQWKFDEPTASSRCPICWQDTPHHHSQGEIEQLRQIDEHVIKQKEDEWQRCLERAASCEKLYPPCQPLYTRTLADHRALVEALEALVREASMLLQNAEGCAANHYGHDMEIHGMPQWLADSRFRITKARATIAALKETDNG